MANVYPIVRPSSSGGARNLLESDVLLSGAIDRSTVGTLGIGGSTATILSLGSSSCLVGVGTSSPSSFLDIERVGTPKSNLDILELTNSGNAVDMDGTGTAILFNQWYYDAVTPAVADAGRIAVITEQDWTSVASTQDAYMSFQVAKDGVVTEYLRITSDGLLKDSYLTTGVGLSESGETALDTTSQSIVGAINEVYSLTSAIILDTAYNNDSGERTITVDDGSVSWDLNTTNNFVVDVSGCNNASSNGTTNFYGFRVENGADEFIAYKDGTDQLSVYATLLDFGVYSSNDILLDSSGDLSFNDQYLSSAITLSESGETVLDTTSQSIVGSINELNAVIAIIPSIITFDDCYNNDSGERTITVDDGVVSWDCNTTYDFQVDIAGCNNPGVNGGFGDYGFRVINGTDNFKVVKTSTDGMSVTAALIDFSIVCASDITLSCTSDLDINCGSATLDSTSGFSIDGNSSSNVSTTGANLTLSTLSSGSLILSSIGELTFKDQYLSSAISLSQSGTAGLSGFTATAIVSALNEVKSGQSGFTAGSVLFASATGTITQDNANFFWDDTNNRLSIGHNSGTDQFSIKDSGVNTSASLGSNLVVNGDFATDLSSWTAGAGWSWSSGTALHTAGNTATLYQGISVTNGSHYQIEVTTAGRTAGSVTISLVGSSETFVISGNSTYTYSFKAGSTATNSLTFTPTTDFDGSLDDVTFKLITPASVYNFSLVDTTGAQSGLMALASQSSLGNLFVGQNAGRYNTIGNNNCFIGASAGYYNTTGYWNSFIGRQAGYSNTTGYNNSFIGSLSGYLNTTGNNNIFIGSLSGYSNTTGYYNSFIGTNAGNSNTTGYYNSFIGSLAGYFNTTGYNNSFIGTNAGRLISTGANNITGNSQVLIGYDTRPLADGDTNEIAIGSSCYGIGSNTVNIGNSSIVTTRLGGKLYLDSGGAYSNAVNSALSFGYETVTPYSWIQSRAAASTAQLILNPQGGNVGIGTTPTAALDINSDIFRLRTAKTPSSASDTGNQGDICWDSSYLYVCTATNTWKRAAITTW